VADISFSCPFLTAYGKIVGAHKLGQMEFIDVFPFISTHIMPGLLSPGSAKADVG